MEPSVAILMLGSLFFILLVIGMPIAFALLPSSTASLFLAFGENGLFPISAVLLSVATNELYLDLPLFTLMAMMLTFSGVVEQIFETTYKLFRNTKGGCLFNCRYGYVDSCRKRSWRNWSGVHCALGST